MTVPTSAPFPNRDPDAPATVYVEAAYLNRALSRLRFAQTGERAAIEHAAALAAETDAANRDLADALSRVHDLEAQLDHLAEILTGRERYVAVLHVRWRKVRAGRTPRQRLARLWRRTRRLLGNTIAVAAALTMALMLLPHLVGR